MPTRTDDTRKETGALLQQKEQIDFQRKQLRTLIDNIPDFIYFKDRESRYLNGNDKFYLGLGAQSIEEIVGKSDYDFFDREVADRFREDEQQALQSGEPLSKEEASYDANGRPIHLHTTKSPILDSETGQVVGLVGISRDITEIKRAREELVAQAANLKAQKEELSTTLEQLKQAQSKLVQSEKMASLGVLTAGIAHEINNPINFVYAGVNSMAKDFEDVKRVVEDMKALAQAPEPAAAIAQLEALRQDAGFDEAFEALEETLKDIKLGATRISAIVAGLSKFSRMGKEDFQFANIHEEVESALVLLRNKYKSHIKIERDYAQRLPAVECCPGKLSQAFMNILSNAIDAIDAKSEGNAGGVITIATRAQGDAVTLSIKDNGTGMSESVRSKIFDPFFTTKAVGKGIGLGMAITHSIIQDHEGQLAVETEEGDGSEFTLTLPVQHESR